MSEFGGFLSLSVFSASMKNPRVIPPRPKAKAAAQPFLPRVAPPFPLGYGPLVYVPSLHRRPRPSKAPELFGGLTQNWRNKALQDEDKPSCQQGGWSNKALQDEDKPSCQQGGWSGDDWKEWKTSSDWSESQDWRWNSWNYQEKWSSQDRTWNSWNYQEQWSQDERYQDQANSWDSHTDEGKDYEYVEVEEIEEEESHEEMIKRSREIVQRYCGHRGDEVPILRSGKRGRSPLLQEEPSSPKQKFRRKRGGRNAKTRNSKPDGERDGEPRFCRKEIGELRYSQLSCKRRFRCGRSVLQLVQGLLNGRVKVSAPFLRLTVFQTMGSDNVPILRCIDNRRLYALKEYAKRSGKHRLMVNVEFYCQHTLNQVQRFMLNSDETDGLNVRLRGGTQ